MPLLADSVSQEPMQTLFERQRKHSQILRLQPVSERKKLLRNFEQFLLMNQERINKEVHADFKKPYAEIELSELYPVITEIRHTLEHLDQWVKPKKIDAPLTYLGTRSEILYEPKGVCLIISPWNYPFNLCLGPLISCLAAGNTAILKPSELTPSASALIRELVNEFFEEDHVAVIEGGIEVSDKLLKFPFDHIFFTGSPAVGKIVMKAAAENLTSVTLELGGKSPVVIDHTADLHDAAKRIAFGKFLNNGQTCVAPDYILVEKSVQEKFLTILQQNIIQLFGDSDKIDESSESYSRIVNTKNFLRIKNLVDDAVSLGAKNVWSGPQNQDSRFFHPTILSGIPEKATILSEEIFGPVLPIIPFQNEDEVIDIINKKPKPLALYVFSQRKAFQKKILSSTSAGAACINDCVIQFSHPNLPFGGVNHSGIGKAHGHHGFISFSNEKPVVRQKRGFSMFYLVYPPYTKRVKKFVDLMMKWS